MAERRACFDKRGEEEGVEQRAGEEEGKEREGEGGVGTGKRREK